MLPLHFQAISWEENAHLKKTPDDSKNNKVVETQKSGKNVDLSAGRQHQRMVWDCMPFSLDLQGNWSATV